MGTGAVVSEGIEPARLEKALAQSDPNDNGPAIDVVRLKPTVSAAAGLASLRRVAEKATRVMNADPKSGGGTYHVLAVQRPAEIINYQSSGATPVIVAVILGASAVAALALTLVAGVRNRRRELALLKTLGYTRRQLASAVAGRPRSRHSSALSSEFRSGSPPEGCCGTSSPGPSTRCRDPPCRPSRSF